MLLDVLVFTIGAGVLGLLQYRANIRVERQIGEARLQVPERMAEILARRRKS